MGEAKRRQNYNEMQRQALKLAIEEMVRIDENSNFPASIVRMQNSRIDIVMEVIESQLQRVNVGCRKGCAFCCYQMVSCSPCEIIKLGQHIIISGKNTPELREKLRAVAALPATPKGRYLTPCPLLVNKECSVYDYRPMACMSHLSVSAKSCEDSHGDDTKSVSLLAEPKGMSALAQFAIDYILMTKYNLSVEKVELCGGLLTMLEADDPIKFSGRWCTGEDVFAHCRDETAAELGMSYPELVKLAVESVFSEIQ